MHNPYQNNRKATVAQIVGWIIIAITVATLVVFANWAPKTTALPVQEQVIEE